MFHSVIPIYSTSHYEETKKTFILLYTDEQIQDIKSNCSGENASIIGIDKTFNLGSCFVSATTYKNKAVKNRESKLQLIFLGPMMLHFDSDFETYSTFLSHLKLKLGDSNFIFWSDEERALTKAIQYNFPDSTYLLCTKHLKDNIRRNLQDRIGCSKDDREKIVKIIFGSKGIAKNSDDSISLETNFQQLKPFFQKYPQFEQYFDQRIKKNCHWTNKQFNSRRPLDQQ